MMNISYDPGLPFPPVLAKIGTELRGRIRRRRLFRSYGALLKWASARLGVPKSKVECAIASSEYRLSTLQHDDEEALFRLQYNLVGRSIVVEMDELEKIFGGLGFDTSAPRLYG
jgi:hypothetical protein